MGTLTGFPDKCFLERPFKVVNRAFLGLARIVNASARINQFSVGIEHIKMRCSKRPIGSHHLLTLVTSIHPWKLTRVHPLHHVIEAIGGVGLFTVRIDADEMDLPVLESFPGFPSHFIRPGHKGTMISGEKDHQYLSVGEIRQTVCSAIRSRQIKIRSLGSISSVKAIVIPPV